MIKILMQIDVYSKQISWDINTEGSGDVDFDLISWNIDVEGSGDADYEQILLNIYAEGLSDSVTAQILWCIDADGSGDAYSGQILCYITVDRGDFTNTQNFNFSQTIARNGTGGARGSHNIRADQRRQGLVDVK